MRPAIVVLVAALAAGPALAQPAPKAATTATTAAATAPQWRVDPRASSLGFASSVDDTAFRGVFTRWTADIRFDPANLARSSIRVVVDPASASSGLAERDRELQKPDWFDTGRHRQVTFQSTSIRNVAAGRYEAAGTLTVKGRATPATLPFALTIAGTTADAQGALTLNRTTLGLGAGVATALVPAETAVTFRVRASRM
jgi:polyisoprenoid-binding protein YceI